MKKQSSYLEDSFLSGETYSTYYEWIKKDFLYFQREHHFLPIHKESDVFSQFWMLWIFRLKENELAYSRRGVHAFAQGEYCLLLPPFSLVEWHVLSPFLSWYGFAWPSLQSKACGKASVTQQEIQNKFKKAVVFKQVFKKKPTSANDIFEILSHEMPLFVIEKEENGCEKNEALKIKKFIDEHYTDEINITDVALNLKFKDYELNRIFKKEFGLNPVHYLQRLRISSSIHSMLFLNTPKVSSVAFDNGFSDLSRFNKNFIKYSKSKPKQHLKVSKINI